MKPSETIGEHIRIGRAVKRMTQAELGKRLGMTQKIISAYECGVSIPPADVFCQIIRILDLNCERLICQVADTCIEEKTND